MKTFFLYARYSSDLQNPKSCEDQLALCRKYVADHEGFIAGEFQDDAESGRTLERPGIENLLKNVTPFKDHIILCESIDRISRDLADIAVLFRSLSGNKITLWTLYDGEITSMHVGIKGYLAQLYSDDLAKKTLRGQIGKAKEGFVSGGVCFGYRQRREYDRNGELIKGLREIDEEEARVIKSIFLDYASGLSLGEIVDRLNENNEPAPSGGEWKINTISGNRKRLSGILNNPLYEGKIVFNRQTWIRTDGQKKKRSIPNPISDWIITEVPELRIIDAALWEQVKLRQSSKEMKRSTKYYCPLSPKLECKSCGSPIWAHIPGRHVCSRHYRHKDCSNTRSFKLQMIMEESGNQLKKALLNGGEDILQQIRQKARQQQEKIKADIKSINRKLDNMMEFVANGTNTDATNRKIAELEQQAARLNVMLTKKIPERSSFKPLYSRFKFFSSLSMDVKVQEELASLVHKIEVDEDHMVEVTPNYEAIFQWLMKSYEKE